MLSSTEEVPKNSSESSDQNDFVRWRKAKKVAVMASFVGKDYLGMQRYDSRHNTTVQNVITNWGKGLGFIPPNF